MEGREPFLSTPVQELDFHLAGGGDSKYKGRQGKLDWSVKPVTD